MYICDTQTKELNINITKTFSIMKWQTIKYTNNGRAYIVSNGRRLHLDNFVCTNSPWGQSGDESIIHKGKEILVHGWYSIGYCGSYGIHLSNCGTSAKVFYKQNF